jgi:hypothetical protein
VLVIAFEQRAKGRRNIIPAKSVKFSVMCHLTVLIAARRFATESHKRSIIMTSLAVMTSVEALFSPVGLHSGFPGKVSLKRSVNYLVDFTIFS